MDGWDMKKWEVYKKRGVCRKRDRDSNIKKKEEEHWEKRVNSATFCIILASSSKLVEGYMLIYFITLAFSSLFWSSGRALSYCSFLFLTNLIDLGQGWTVQLTVLSGFGPLDFFVLTTTFKLFIIKTFIVILSKMHVACFVKKLIVILSKEIDKNK